MIKLSSVLLLRVNVPAQSINVYVNCLFKTKLGEHLDAFRTDQELSQVAFHRLRAGAWGGQSLVQQQQIFPSTCFWRGSVGQQVSTPAMDLRNLRMV